MFNLKKFPETLLAFLDIRDCSYGCLCIETSMLPSQETPLTPKGDKRASRWQGDQAFGHTCRCICVYVPIRQVYNLNMTQALRQWTQAARVTSTYAVVADNKQQQALVGKHMHMKYLFEFGCISLSHSAIYVLRVSHHGGFNFGVRSTGNSNTRASLTIKIIMTQ